MTSTAITTTGITLNGRSIATAATTLADLIEEQGLAETKVATAVNGEFVAARVRRETLIGDGDRIEILSARQGG